MANWPGRDVMYRQSTEIREAAAGVAGDAHYTNHTMLLKLVVRALVLIACVILYVGETKR